MNSLVRCFAQAEEDVENAMALAKHEHDLHHLMKVRQSFPYPLES